MQNSLYRHFDKAGTLLYVGMSVDPVMRLKQHKYASRWFNDISRIEIEHFETREKAIAAEKEAIIREKPEYNISHRTARNTELRSMGKLTTTANIPISSRLKKEFDEWRRRQPGFFSVSDAIRKLMTEAIDAGDRPRHE